MNREQVKEELLKGRTLEELFEFHPGQECDIYKGEFSLSDEIIYIPDLDLNEIPIHEVVENYVGDMMLNEVRSIDLQIAIKELLEEGIAKSSISEALNRLSDCFASAVNNRYMLTNPAHDLVVPFKEEPWKERRWLNVDEIKIFLDETKESYPFWFPLHYIMIYTGMRIGEVGGLKWEDVHLEGGYIELKQALLAEYKQGKN